MTREESLTKAGEAQRIIDSQIFKDISAAITNGLIAQMKRVPVKDDALQSKLILTLQLWGQVEGYLNSCVQDGKVVEFQIAQEDKKRRFGIF